MFTTDFGTLEFLVMFVVVVFNLALPVAFLFVLYQIYAKLKNIEEHLKKN